MTQEEDTGQKTKRTQGEGQYTHVTGTARTLSPAPTYSLSLSLSSTSFSTSNSLLLRSVASTVSSYVDPASASSTAAQSATHPTS
eukprot:CAMPEP_0173311586 /NCGR_PEP_ID=MMETSP1143-20121109/23617_1 /TAXON_ID=483371 /ORGANISM="non described non described, Strain CCMP2298" /LENGTH=84 /DNA_ID=CAMNT_0014253603 /DNA_START=34 /DNA_END=285 /DNA_ORIENTATION=-